MCSWLRMGPPLCCGLSRGSLKIYIHCNIYMYIVGYWMWYIKWNGYHNLSRFRLKEGTCTCTCGFASVMQIQFAIYCSLWYCTAEHNAHNEATCMYMYLYMQVQHISNSTRNVVYNAQHRHLLTLTMMLRMLTKFFSVWRSSDAMCLRAESALEWEGAAVPLEVGVANGDEVGELL